MGYGVFYQEEKITTASAPNGVAKEREATRNFKGVILGYSSVVISRRFPFYLVGTSLLLCLHQNQGKFLFPFSVPTISAAKDCVFPSLKSVV